jgi:hypothetical protein
LLEVSVTNKGDISIAKNWRLCLVLNDKPLRYTPEEIKPDDLATYENKVSLEPAGVGTPIERGHAVTGWLLFHVAEEVVRKGFDGGIQCQDYLGKRYMATFATPPREMESIAH